MRTPRRRKTPKATARLTSEQGYGMYIPSEKEVESDGLRQWLAEIAQTPMLTPPEEYQLAIRVASGDRQAKEHFIRANLRLVVSIARKYVRNNIALLDIIQDGNIGLMKAVEKFDYTRGYKFSTYATWWVRQAIIRGLEERGRMMKIPAHADETARKILGITSRLRNELGHEPTPEEIAEAASQEPYMRLSGQRLKRPLTADDIEMIIGWTLEPLSLDMPMEDWGGDSGQSFASGMVDEQATMPDELIDRDALRERVRDALATLPNQRYRDVVSLRYGIDDGQDHTLEEVGRVLGVTRERVRQIEVRALRMLRPVLQREQWKEAS